MKTQMRVILLVAAALYMAWGLALLLAPDVAQGLISNGVYDPSMTAMFGAALLGMMVTFVIAAYDPEKEIVRASAVGMAFVGFTAAFLIFIGKSMPLSSVTVISLVVDLGACGMLFLTEARLDLKRQPAKTGSRAPRKPALARRHA